MFDSHPWNEYYYELELSRRSSAGEMRMAKKPTVKQAPSGWPPAGSKGKTVPMEDAVCPPYDPDYQGKNALPKGSD